MGSWNNLGKKCTEFNDACVIFRACKIINKINSNPQRCAGLQTWFAPLVSPSICSHSGCISWPDNVILWRKLPRLGTDSSSCWSAEIRADSYLSYRTRYQHHLFCYYFSWRNDANVRTLNGMNKSAYFRPEMETLDEEKGGHVLLMIWFDGEQMRTPDPFTLHQNILGSMICTVCCVWLQ